VPQLSVSDETSSRVLYTLQWSDGRLGKACEYRVAVVQLAEQVCRDQTRLVTSSSADHSFSNDTH